MKKYELLEGPNFTKNIFGGINARTIHRIIAIRNFGDVKAGDIGGWVEKESNLSHYGNCWIYNDAMAIQDSTVDGNAQLRDGAKLYHESIITDDAIVSGKAYIYEKAIVRDVASVSGNARIGGTSDIYNCATIEDNAKISGASRIYGGARIFDNVEICDYIVGGDTEIGGRRW